MRNGGTDRREHGGGPTPVGTTGGMPKGNVQIFTKEHALYIIINVIIMTCHAIYSPPPSQYIGLEKFSYCMYLDAPFRYFVYYAVYTCNACKIRRK